MKRYFRFIIIYNDNSSWLASGMKILPWHRKPYNDISLWLASGMKILTRLRKPYNYNSLWLAHGMKILTRLRKPCNDISLWLAHGMKIHLAAPILRPHKVDHQRFPFPSAAACKTKKEPSSRRPFLFASGKDRSFCFRYFIPVTAFQLSPLCAPCSFSVSVFVSLKFLGDISVIVVNSTLSGHLIACQVLIIGRDLIDHLSVGKDLHDAVGCSLNDLMVAA